MRKKRLMERKKAWNWEDLHFFSSENCTFPISPSSSGILPILLLWWWWARMGQAVQRTKDKESIMKLWGHPLQIIEVSDILGTMNPTNIIIIGLKNKAPLQIFNTCLSFHHSTTTGSSSFVSRLCATASINSSVFK